MAATITTLTASGSLTTVETITDVARFEALREEWSELLEASSSDCIFLTWEWLYTWWKHLAGDRQLSIVVVRSGGRMVALAPFCLRPARLLSRRPLPVMEFLGTGCVGSDYLDFIIRRGHEVEARRAFAACLAKQQQVLDWTQLREGSCAAAGVAADLEERGWTASETLSNICPLIPLAGMSWEAYLATLGAEHRYNFNRKWKHLNRDYRVRFLRADTEEECRESVDLVMELHNSRWRDRGGSNAFDTPMLVGFHHEVTRLALKRGWLRLYVLRLNGRPAAGLYGFLYGRTFYFYQSGFDATYHKQSVGLISMGLSIKNAIEEGAKEYDLLHGGEDYKSHWSRESRRLSRLELYPPGRVGRICRSSAEFERALRRFARRLLSKVFA